MFRGAMVEVVALFFYLADCPGAVIKKESLTLLRLRKNVPMLHQMIF